jgi:predicted GIY-YIG superfamily endonuclease
VDECYIGRTRNLEKRYKHHLRAIDTAIIKNRWILDLKRKGLKPIVKEIVRVDTFWRAITCENQYIKHYSRQGLSLLNKGYTHTTDPYYTLWTWEEVIKDPTLVPDLFMN